MPVTQSPTVATAGIPAWPGPLMSMRDIAELAQVRRPVVTTWRRRYADFPPPAAGDMAQPLFDARQVADWLISTGRAERDRIGPDLSLYTLAGFGGRLPPRDLIAFVTALVCLRHLDGDEPLADGSDNIIAAIRDRAGVTDPDDELLLSEIRRLPADGGWLAAATDELVEAAWGCRAAFEWIMGARHRLRAADIFATAVTGELASLIARLSGAAERSRLDSSVIVTDLSAGPGDLLTAIVDLLGADASPTCTAAENDPYLARLLRRRLATHGLPLVDMDVRVGDELADESGEPDVIVTQIPYTPGEERSAEDALDVLDDVSMRLRPGCTAVVLGPSDALVGELPPYSEAERRRAAILKDGMVEAVIRLPGGMVPFRSGYESALWVMTSARDSPWAGRVLLADVSDRELTEDVASTLAEDVVTWRREGYDPDAHTRAFGVQVLVGDLVAHPPKPLTARRPRSIRTAPAEAADRLAHVLSLETELDRVAAHATAVRPPIRVSLAADVRPRPAIASIGGLARGGGPVHGRHLTVLSGMRLDPGDINPDGHHAVLGPDEVLGLRSPGHRTVDRAVLATRYPRARLTEPGDVLVTTVPVFGALVDQDGFGVTEFPVRALRIVGAGRAVLTPRVLAAMLNSGNQAARPGGAVRATRRMEDHQVPLLPPDEVARLDVLLAEVGARRDSAQREIDLLDEFCAIITVGLGDGTLSITGAVT
jgi:hypothetical protein